MLLNIYLRECSRAEYLESVAGVSLILKSMSSSEDDKGSTALGIMRAVRDNFMNSNNDAVIF